MDILKDRRVVLAAGAGLALAAGLAVAALMAARHQEAPGASPASQGGLVVQMGRDDDIKLEATRPLRCFVNGLLVGQLPLADCAKRNGVATGALDVGLDPSGALAASHGLSADITPLPPPPGALAMSAAPGGDGSQTDGDAPPASAPAAPRAGAAACLKYAEASWTRLNYDTTLDACVQILYAGQCVAAGGALYGRWGDRTLRLVPGRVEISGDNRTFHALAAQGPACSLPPVALPSRGSQSG
jgi:hypothetical protein